jgi:hypothetical protein
MKLCRNGWKENSEKQFKLFFDTFQAFKTYKVSKNKLSIP